MSRNLVVFDGTFNSPPLLLRGAAVTLPGLGTVTHTRLRDPWLPGRRPAHLPAPALLPAQARGVGSHGPHSAATVSGPQGPGAVRVCKRVREGPPAPWKPRVRLWPLLPRTLPPGGPSAHPTWPPRAQRCPGTAHSCPGPPEAAAWLPRGRLGGPRQRRDFVPASGHRGHSQPWGGRANTLCASVRPVGSSARIPGPQEVCHP